MTFVDRYEGAEGVGLSRNEFPVLRQGRKSGHEINREHRSVKCRRPTLFHPSIFHPSSRLNEKSRDPRLEYQSRTPGVTNRCFWFTISHCQLLYTCMHKRDIRLDLEGSRFPYPFEDMQGILFLRVTSILGYPWWMYDERLSCALLFPIVFLLFFFSFSFELYFKIIRIIRIVTSKLVVKCSFRSILLVFFSLNVYCYCSLLFVETVFLEFENGGIDGRINSSRLIASQKLGAKSTCQSRCL